MPRVGTAAAQPARTSQPVRSAASGTAKMPTLSGRVADTVSGAVKSTGAAFSNAGGVLLDTARHLDTLNSQEYRKSVQEAENAAHYREMLSRGTLDDGTVLDAAGKQRLEMLAQRAEQRAGIYREGAEATHAPISRVISDVYGTADELADSAAQDLADAKEGAGAVGSFLVDAGAAGVQLAGDIGLVALTGGSAMPVVAARTFGSSTQKARQEGADLGQQLAYGTASAALSVATEKISNVASPFRKAFGAGAADKLAGTLVSRFGESTAVQTMQKLSQTAMGKIAASAIGEGSEEFVEDVFQPVLQRATYDPDARFDLSDALRDAAIGAVLGGVGGAVDVGMGRVQGKENAAPETEAAESVKQGTPDPADVDLVARVLNGGTETGSVQAGRVTVIQKPYQGKTPVQTQKSTAAVTVDSGSVQAAQNLINGSYGPEGAALEKSFKATLKNAYKAVFKPSKNVPVSGVTFDGRPYTVDIPGSVPGKVISDPNLTAEKLALLDILPQVVQNGEYVGSGQYVQHGSKQKNTVRYDYFETLAKINGRSYMVSFDVEVFPDVNNYRTHKLNEIELFPATDADTGRDPAAGGQETAPVEGTRPLNSDFTIPQGAESVKQGAPDPADVDLVARILSGGEETGTLRSKENTTPVPGTAVNENGLTALTDQEKINLSSGKRNKIISTFSDAVSFVKNALAVKQSADRAYLGKVPDTVARRVWEDTGVDITGYRAILPSDNVRHIIKNHGDAASESARGQSAVTAEDIARIPEVLAEPDHVRLSPDRDSRGRDVLIFEKQIGNQYVTMQAVSDGTHSIQTDTLYKQKRKDPHVTEYYDASDLTGPAHNARSVPPQGLSYSDFTIPQDAEPVNSGTPDPADVDLVTRVLGGEDPSGDARRDSIGAAKAGFDPYTNKLNEYGAIPTGEKPAREIDVPSRTESGNKVSYSARTILEAAATPDSAVGEIGQAVVDGKFSFIPVANKTVRDRAEKTIQRLGFTGAVAKFKEDVNSGKASEEITALGTVLYNAAANAGNTKMALDLAYDLSVSARNGARATQAMRILKTLTPSGKLYMLQKEVNRINETYTGKIRRMQSGSSTNTTQSGPEFTGSERGYGNAGTGDMRKTAGKGSKTRKKPKATDNVPVDQWMQKVGEELADSLAARTKEPKQRTRTVTQTILSDLRKFAAETAPKGAVAGGRSEMERIRDLFQNQDAYQEAWEAAKATLSKEFENNPKALQAFDDWFKSSLDYGERLTKELTGQDQITIDTELSDAYLHAENAAEQAAALDAIYQDIANQMPADWKERWRAWRYMSMLTNPRTHIRNIVGNIGFQPLRMVKNEIAAAIEAGLEKAGHSVERTKSFAASPELYRSAWKDFENVADVLSGNQYSEKPETEIQRRRTIFRLQPLERLRKGNSAVLELEDTLFKRITYADSLAGYLRANGVSAAQLETGKVDPEILVRAREYASQEALKATYQDTNAISNRFVKIADSLGFIGEAVLPFRRTPANILARGLEYSPAGLAKALTYDCWQVKNGKKTAAEAIDSIAAGLTGSALMGLGAYLFSEGLIRGGSGDSKEDAYNELLGHQPYSLELPDGASVTLDWLAPESLPFFMGVELASAMGEEGMDAEAIMTALVSTASPLLELSMLQGVNDLIESVSFSDGPKLLAMIPSVIVSYFTQALPTLGGQIERSFESKRMSTYTDKNSGIPTDIQYALGRASSRIPILDYQQVPYIDAWGREEQTGDLPYRILNNFFNPAYLSEVNETPVDQEIQEIYSRTGSRDVLPDRAPRYFTVDGERIDLTADQYIRYATKRGNDSYQIITDIMENAAFETLTDEGKVHAIDEIYSYADAMARASVSDYTPPKWMLEVEAERIDPATAILFRAMEWEGKEAETSRYQKYHEMVRAGLSEREQMEALRVVMTESEYEGLADAYQSGVTPEQFVSFLEGISGLSTDKGPMGKTISGSLKRKVMQFIDSMDLNNAQKTALYYAAGYKESTLDDAPWYGRSEYDPWNIIPRLDG